MSESDPSARSKIKLCVIVTPAFALYFLHRKQFAYFEQNGFEVVAIAGEGPEHDWLRQEGVDSIAIPMVRPPNPLRDLMSLVRLCAFLLRHRFDVVQVSTPKAGLLGALAATLTGHRRLIYTVRGRAYENMTGPKRKLMMSLEWLTCSLATRVLAISHELASTVVREGLCKEEKIRVIGSGSGNGVDLEQFSRSDDNVRRGRQLRDELGIGEEDVVILALGRIRRDKGINELVSAFVRIAEHRPETQLVLLGVFEYEDPLTPAVTDAIRTHPRIHHVDWARDPAFAYAAADILAFPSYREGFGNVALEAAAMEIPVVATDIMGCREAIADGRTGLLVPPRDADALQEALERVLSDPQIRRDLGRQGRARVEREFKPERIWHGLIEEYRALLGTRRT